MTSTELLRKDFAIEKILYKRTRFCKCYTTYQNHIIFEMIACEHNLTYALTGHAYEPTLYAECSVPRFSFIIHGDLGLPSLHDNDWEDFCRNLGMEITSRVAWLHNSPINYEVDFNLLNRNRCRELLYDGQPLKYGFFPVRDPNLPYQEPVFFVEHPNPKNLPKPIPYGFPGEYYCPISELTIGEKEMIQTIEGKPIITKKDIRFLYHESHPRYGSCYVCSENIDGHCVDGYYDFNENGILTKMGNVR